MDRPIISLIQNLNSIVYELQDQVIINNRMNIEAFCPVCGNITIDVELNKLWQAKRTLSSKLLKTTINEEKVSERSKEK